MVLPLPSLAWCRYDWERAGIQARVQTRWRRRAAWALGFTIPEFTVELVQSIHFWVRIRRWFQRGHDEGVAEPKERAVTRSTAPGIRAGIELFRQRIYAGGELVNTAYQYVRSCGWNGEDWETYLK